MMNKENILGISVCAVHKTDLLAAVQSDIKQDKRRFIVAINPEKILKAKNDMALAELLNSADYQIPDGIGVVLASKIKKGCIRERMTGIECMDMICIAAAQYGYRIFLYGARPEIVKKTKKILEQKYNKICIAGYENGYCSDNSALVTKINDSQADIVFVALGSPKQEYWIAQNKDSLCAKIYQGVGGSFDVVSGSLKRAPTWMQKCGLEWFFRLLQQPRRIFRQLKMFKFLFLIFKDGNNED